MNPSQNPVNLVNPRPELAERPVKNSTGSNPPPPHSAPASPFLSPSSRTGKIARLPAHIRQQLNQRLLDNHPGQTILSWLNSLAETRQVLREHFNNNPVTPQNLSEWRQGGCREALLREDLLSHAAGLNESAGSLNSLADPLTLADNLATVLAARYAALLNSWDGEPSPAIENKIKLLRSLTRDILALQKSLHQAHDLRRARARQDAETAAAGFEKSKAAHLAKLKIPLRTKSHAYALGPGAPLLAQIEAASTPEELARLIQPDPTNSSPSPSQSPSQPPSSPPTSPPAFQPDQTTLTE